MISYDRTTAHKLFGYRLQFDPEMVTSFYGRGKPTTKSDREPESLVFRTKAGDQGEELLPVDKSNP